MNIPTLLEKVNFFKEEKRKKKEKTGGGVCVICSSEYSFGYSMKDSFSGNFTDYNILNAGDIVCEYCFGCLKSSKIRRSNWIVTDKEYYTFSWDEFFDIMNEKIFDQNIEYFSIFITKDYKKHGWLIDVRCINFSTEKFSLIYGKTKVTFTKAEWERQIELASSLIKVFGKQNLKTLIPNQHKIKILLTNNLYKEYLEAREKRNLLTWDLITTCIPNIKKDEFLEGDFENFEKEYIDIGDLF